MTIASQDKPAVAGKTVDTRPIKLACRNVWKLYGSGATEFIQRRNGKASSAELVGGEAPRDTHGSDPGQSEPRIGRERCLA